MKPMIAKVIENKYWDKKCDCSTCGKALLINSGEKFLRLTVGEGINICEECFKELTKLYEGN